MLERRDRFAGNILFYDYLYKTKRLPFLERNRKQVHQDLSHSRYEETGTDFRSKWRPPSWDLLDDMISAEKAGGSFVLEVHGIRLQSDSSWQAPRTGDVHDPVKKVRTVLRLPTSIKTSVVSSSSNSPCINPPDREAVIRVTDRRSDREASVEMEPIIICRENWYTDPSRIDDNDFHMMMLSINFENHTSIKELYNFMGVNTSDKSARLSTSYRNIFDVPQGRVVLPLRASGIPLGIGLEVSMHWNTTKRDSVLTSYNRHLKRIADPPSSYPTPPLDIEPRYKLTFVYGNDTLERSELVCPHCSKRKTTDIEDLKMHLISWHEYFDYQVIQERIDEYGVEHWRFESEVANYRTDQRQRASDNADEPYDVRVLAPARPFDRRRYLAGDNEFERAARTVKPTRHSKAKPTTSAQYVPPPPRLRKPPDQVQSRPRREKKTFVVPKAPTGVTFFRSLSKRPLRAGEVISESDDELDEGWMYRRKHAEIDKLGLPETARRFLKIFDDFMHEESLQSDMHVGDSIIRFARECGVRICRDGATNEFTKKLDELLEEDIISKEVHSKALEIVRDPEAKVHEANELSQRLEQLDVQYEETSLNPAGYGNGVKKAHVRKKDRKGKGKAVVTETGYLTPTTADLDGNVDMSDASLSMPAESLDTSKDEDTNLPYDLCYCGEDASMARGKVGILACNNIGCIRRSFHRVCIQQHTKIPLACLPQRSRNWTCNDCKAESSTAT